MEYAVISFLFLMPEILGIIALILYYRAKKDQTVLNLLPAKVVSAIAIICFMFCFFLISAAGRFIVVFLFPLLIIFAVISIFFKPWYVTLLKEFVGLYSIGIVLSMIFFIINLFKK